MHKKRLWLLGIVLAWGSIRPLLAFDLNAIRGSIFKISVVTQSPNFRHPWLHSNQTSSSGTGFYIGENQILTNAHVVANARFITVQRDGDDKALIATTKFIAHDSDLALLEVEDPKSLKGTRPLAIGGLPKLRKPVATIGYPLGGEQISVTEGIVSRISYRTYAHSGYHRHLLIQVDSAINPGNSGGPVVQGEYVVGVAFQAYDDAENTGYIIPPQVINRFLDDIKDGTYQGHPDIGLIVMEGILDNHATRTFHGLIDGQAGVKVTFVANYSALYGKIFKGDVIFAIDKHPIGQDGKITFEGERVNFKSIYDLKQIGDKALFSVVRDKKVLDVLVDITKSPVSQYQANIFPRFPRYEIFAGLVFSVLSRDYLKNWGARWFRDAPIKLRHLHWNYLAYPRFRGVDEIVVLSTRLPDPVNAEAEEFEENIVDTINDVQITNLSDIQEALKTGHKDFIVINLWGVEPPLVLPRKASEESHHEILRRYGVFPERWLGEVSSFQ